MTDIIRHCPNCGWERPFTQHHAGPGGCPDVPDDICPEWVCVACGTAVILGDVPIPIQARRSASLQARVA